MACNLETTKASRKHTDSIITILVFMSLLVWSRWFVMSMVNVANRDSRNITCFQDQEFQYFSIFVRSTMVE